MKNIIEEVASQDTKKRNLLDNLKLRKIKVEQKNVELSMQQLKFHKHFILQYSSPIFLDYPCAYCLTDNQECCRVEKNGKMVGLDCYIDS